MSKRHGSGKALTVVAIVAAIGAVEYRADACSKSSYCTYSASVSPATGLSMPANAPAIVLFPSDASPSVAPLPQLFDANGDPVSIDVVTGWPELLVVPKAPLAAGHTYKLRFDDGCDGYKPVEAGTSIPVERSVATTSESPLPQTTGSVKLVSYEVRPTHVYIGSQCYTDIKAAVATLNLEPSSDLLPYMPVSMIEVSVDGVKWNRSRYGSLAQLPNVDGPSQDSTRVPLQMFAACEKPPLQDTDEGVTPGKHTVSVQAHVAGASKDPAPALIEIDLQCPPVALDGGADSALADTGNGVDSAEPTSDAAPDSSAEAGEPEASADQVANTSSGGCTTAPGGRSHPWGIAGLVALAALAARRAARARRRTGRRADACSGPWKLDRNWWPAFLQRDGDGDARLACADKRP